MPTSAPSRKGLAGANPMISRELRLPRGERTRGVDGRRRGRDEAVSRPG